MTRWYKCHGCWCQVKASKARVALVPHEGGKVFCSNKCIASFARGKGLDYGECEGCLDSDKSGEHGLNEFYGRNFEEPPRVPEWAKATAWAMTFTTWGLALAAAAQWAFGG